MTIATNQNNTRELILFLINGVIATFIHLIILITLVNFSGMSYGVSNFCAAIFGISASFFGNKFFVFGKKNDLNLKIQIIRFLSLYSFLAINHGFLLFLWSDLNGLNYLVGFLIITFLNTSISFLVNKFVIFYEE